MTRKEILDFCRAYMGGLDELKVLLRRVPHGALKHRPFPDAWTIHEHVIHAAMSESFAYSRLQFMQAQPGTMILAYDEEKWTANLDWHAQDWRPYFELFAAFRSLAAREILNRSADYWADKSYEHPTLGRMDLGRWFELYTRHGRDHAEYIRRNLRLYRESRKK